MITNRVYTQEFRDQIVKEYRDGKSYEQISKEHNLALSTISHWINRSKNKGVPIKTMSPIIRKTTINDLDMKEILKFLIDKLSFDDYLSVLQIMYKKTE
jgi:transposase